MLDLQVLRLYSPPQFFLVIPPAFLAGLSGGCVLYPLDYKCGKSQRAQLLLVQALLE